MNAPTDGRYCRIETDARTNQFSCRSLGARQVFAVDSRLELVDEVSSEEELVAGGAVVVTGAIPTVVEAELGAEHDGGAEVPGHVERVLGVLAGDAGALTFLVVEQVAAEADHHVRIDFAIDVVDDGVLGREAG